MLEKISRVISSH